MIIERKPVTPKKRSLISDVGKWLAGSSPAVITPVLGDGDAGRPDADRDRQLGDLLGGERRRRRRSRTSSAGRSPSGSMRSRTDAVGADEPLGRVDDLLEERARVADRGDLGGDLAERLLGVGAAGELGRGPVELLDEAGVLDRDRGLVGERLIRRASSRRPRPRSTGVDRERAEDPAGLVAQRRRQDRVEAGVLDELVGRARRGSKPASLR